jgi:hypothetical protein
MPFDEFFATTYVNVEDSGYKRDCLALLEMATCWRDYLALLDQDMPLDVERGEILEKIKPIIADFFPATSLGLKEEDLPTFQGSYEQQRAPRSVRREMNREVNRQSKKRSSYKDGVWTDDQKPVNDERS